MKTLKIVFYGTPEFATGVLKTLHESSHSIVAVVTAPDKPAGRGRQLQQSHVKKYALSQGLNVLQPTNLKSESFLQELKAFQADLQVIVAFRMLPQAVWSMPPLGTFNLHASLLPQYRGAAPINWAIINRENTTGVTTFFIDDKIDTGMIIDQESCPIAANETVGSLYSTLMSLGSSLCLRTVNNIALGTIRTRKQNEAAALKDAPKLTNSNMHIDWNKAAVDIDAQVRGLYPYPIAKATLVQEQPEQVKIYKTAVQDKNHEVLPGTLIIENCMIKVACGSGFLEILELQLPNKKQMSSKDLLNGYSFSANARMDVAL